MDNSDRPPLVEWYDDFPEMTEEGKRIYRDQCKITADVLKHHNKPGKEKKYDKIT